MSFADRLKNLRKKYQYSQTQLAEKAGIHYTQIGRYEKGACFPNSDTLQRISKALGTTTNYLMDGATGDLAKVQLRDRELLEKFKQVETLSDEDKEVVKTLIDAFLIKKHIQKMV